MSDGLLVINKPSGPTSHDVVALVRRTTGIRRVGHAGTLDPMATGVVVVGLGRATRLLRYVQDGTKDYLATVRFGIGTDTLDAEGQETSRQPMPFEAVRLAKVMEAFLGDIEQVPPMFSAVKVKGKRLHELARAGKEIDRVPRKVSIYRLHLAGFEPGDHPRAVLEIECSKGTYIRSLADDIARALGGRAHLEMLHRTRVGPFRIDEALTFENVETWRSRLLEPVAAVEGMPRMIATPDQVRAVADGRPVESAIPDGDVAILDPGGRLLGVYESRDGIAKAAVVLT